MLAAIDKLSKMTPGFDGKCPLKLAAIWFLSLNRTQFPSPKHLKVFV